MAEITPTDIVNKEFNTTWRGYTRHEVDDFLQQTSDSLYRALEENQRLRAQLADLHERLQHYQNSESLITNALVLAERTADEQRLRAHQDADLIRREAEDTLRREHAEIDEIRQLRFRLIAEIRAMLHAHISLLDSQERQQKERAVPPISRKEAD